MDMGRGRVVKDKQDMANRPPYSTIVRLFEEINNEPLTFQEIRILLLKDPGFQHVPSNRRDLIFRSELKTLAGIRKILMTENRYLKNTTPPAKDKPMTINGLNRLLQRMQQRNVRLLGRKGERYNLIPPLDIRPEAEGRILQCPVKDINRVSEGIFLYYVSSLFHLSLTFLEYLKPGNVHSELNGIFSKHGFPLSGEATIEIGAIGIPYVPPSIMAKRTPANDNISNLPETIEEWVIIDKTWTFVIRRTPKQLVVNLKINHTILDNIRSLATVVKRAWVAQKIGMYLEKLVTIRTIKNNGLLLGYCYNMLSFFIKANGLHEEDFHYAFDKIECMVKNERIKKEMKSMINDFNDVRRVECDFVKHLTLDDARRQLETDTVGDVQRQLLQVRVAEEEYRRQGLHRYLSSALLNEKPLLLFDMRHGP